MTFGRTFVVSSLASALALTALATASLAQPMVQGENITKVSEHVYVIPDGSVPGVPNVGIIVGETGTLIIDTGMGPKNGEIVFRAASKVSGKNRLYLATTHIHPEHDLGAQAFPDSTTMIRSRAQVSEIEETGYRTRDAFRSRSEALDKLLAGAEFRKADVLFDEQYELDLGGLKVQLIAMGPNHTPGDTAIFVPAERVLFAGDIAMKALPAFASDKSSLDHWLESLDRLEALEPAVLVPSHGPIGDTAFIDNYREFLTAVRSRTAALAKQGKSLDQITESVTAELAERFSSSPRIAGAIRSAYAELGSR